jgi:hypothetical protein
MESSPAAKPSGGRAVRRLAQRPPTRRGLPDPLLNALRRERAHGLPRRSQ